MKFRVLAGATALAMLLSATACGTGNMANNAYGVNRTGHNVVHRTNTVRQPVSRSFTRPSVTERGAATTGRAMNDTVRNTPGQTRSHVGMSGRMGNALHNTRTAVSHNYNRSVQPQRATGATRTGTMRTGAARMGNAMHNTRTARVHNTGQIHEGININYDGTAYDGTPNGVTTARNTEGRVVAQSRNAGQVTTAARNTTRNEARNATRSTTRNATRNTVAPAARNTAAATPATSTRAYQNERNFQNTVYSDNAQQSRMNVSSNTNAVNTTNRNYVAQSQPQNNNGRTLVNNANYAGRNNVNDTTANNFNWQNNNTHEIHRNGWKTRYQGAVPQNNNDQSQQTVHHLNQNGQRIAANAHNLRRDTNQIAQNNNQIARNGYLINDTSAFDNNVIVRDGASATGTQRNATRNTSSLTSNNTNNRPINRTAETRAAANRTTSTRAANRTTTNRINNTRTMNSRNF